MAIELSFDGTFIYLGGTSNTATNQFLICTINTHNGNVLRSTLVSNAHASDGLIQLTRGLGGLVYALGTTKTDFNTIGVDTTDGDAIILTLDMWITDDSCPTTFYTDTIVVSYDTGASFAEVAIDFLPIVDPEVGHMAGTSTSLTAPTMKSLCTSIDLIPSTSFFPELGSTEISV